MQLDAIVVAAEGDSADSPLTEAFTETTASPYSATSPCAGRTKLTLVQPSASWYCMTFGIGSFASVSSFFAFPCAGASTRWASSSSAAMPVKSGGFAGS